MARQGKAFVLTATLNPKPAMKTSITFSGIFRNVAIGLVVTGLSLAGLTARAQTTAAPVKPETPKAQADREAAFKAELASLFDVRAPHGAAKKSAACACQRDPAAAASLQAPADSLPAVAAQPDLLAAEVAALFDVQIPAKLRKDKPADKK